MVFGTESLQKLSVVFLFLELKFAMLAVQVFLILGRKLFFSNWKRSPETENVKNWRILNFLWGLKCLWISLFFLIPFLFLLLFLFYSILFYSILFYSILFYSILFYSIQFYSILFYSISILFYSTLFYSTLAITDLYIVSGKVYFKSQITVKSIEHN